MVKKSKEITLLKSIYNTIIVVIFHIGFWFIIHSNAEYNDIDVINMVSWVMLFLALIVPLLNGRRELLFLWHRKKLSKERWNWVWDILINAIYIGIGYLLYRGICFIFEVLHSLY